jgi:hypothetical protein
MINWIKNLFTETTAIDTKIEAANSAPYKVPEPAAFTIIPLVADKAVEAVVKSVAKAKPAVKKAATKAKDTVKKPATRGRKPKTK